MRDCSPRGSFVLYGSSVVFAAVGVAWTVYTAVTCASCSGFVIGATWLTIAFSWFLVARQYHRREQLGLDQELPGAGQDVLTTPLSRPEPYADGDGDG